MWNLALGIPTLLICILGYAVAWRFYTKQHYTATLGMIMLCGLVLRIFVASDLFLHPWDERFHALVAKNLLLHPFIPTLYDNPVLPYDSREWFANHIWLHKQPFPLWSMALSIKLFGINEFALRIPSILLSTLCILAIYQTGRYLFDRRTALLAAFLFSIHGFIIELTGGRDATDHIDIFFLCLILFSLAFSIRYITTRNYWFNLLAGICLGLAILSKWLPALIVIPVYLLLLMDSRRFKPLNIAGILLFDLLIAFLVALPWQIYILDRYPAEALWEYRYNSMHITSYLNDLKLPFYYHFDHLQIKYGPVGLLAVLWLLYKYLKKPRNLRRLAILFWILVPVLFFSFVKTKMQAYTLFIAPAVVLITSFFFRYLWFYRRLFRFRAIPVILMASLFLFPVWQTIERSKILTTRDRYPEWSRKIKELRIPENEGKTLVFQSEHPIETMFYHHCTAYPHLPGISVMDSLAEAGYTIMILDPSGKPETHTKNE